MTAEIKLVQDRGNDKTIALLYELLSRAEQGEVVGLVGMAELRGGLVESFGTATWSRLQTAGALLELAVGRVQE